MPDPSEYVLSLADGDLPFFAFDTETTGKSPQTAHIITYGISDGPGDNCGLLLDLPESVKSLDADNVKVHGFTLERIRAEGEARKESLRALYAALQERIDRGLAIAGHNVAYDLTLLQRELERIGVTDSHQTISSWPVIDTMVLIRDFVNFDISTRLFPMAQMLGVPEDVLRDAHTAEADAEVSAHTLLQAARYLPHITASTAEQLLERVRSAALRIQQTQTAIFGYEGSGFPILDVREQSKPEKVVRKRPEKAGEVKKSSSGSARTGRTSRTGRTAHSASKRSERTTA